MLAQRKEEYAFYEEPLIEKPAARPQPSVDRSLRRKCAIFVAVFAVLAMVTTVRSETIVTEGYALVRSKAQVTQLEKENNRLKLDIARLKSPQRIDQRASADLGMIVPKEVYFASSQKS